MRAIADSTNNNLLREQFVPDHVFIYVMKGSIRVFDGDRHYLFKEGDSCLARKNRLFNYELIQSDIAFEPVLFCFDEPFLKAYQQKHALIKSASSSSDSFITLPKSNLITSFIQSVQPYYKGAMQLDAAFEDVKYEELLIILLRLHPELSSVLFDFGIPQRVNLEAFMNKNFRFNVSIGQFATLTGRSTSSFKRDFQAIFHDTPGRWLVKRRLQEAYFLMDKKDQKPNAIYLGLGFESLSHFSVAFKKEFHYSPSEFRERK